MNVSASLLGLATLAVALALPSAARADDPEGEAPATHRSADNTKLLAGGLVFAGAYAGSAGLAYWASTKGADASELYIPVFGPVVGIVNIESNIQHCYHHGGDLCGVQRLGSLFAYPFLAFDAIAQGGGVGFFVAGLIGSDSPSPKQRARAAARPAHVTPYTTGTTVGLTGTF